MWCGGGKWRRLGAGGVRGRREGGFWMLGEEGDELWEASRWWREVRGQEWRVDFEKEGVVHGGMICLTMY